MFASYQINCHTEFSIFKQPDFWHQEKFLKDLTHINRHGTTTLTLSNQIISNCISNERQVALS